MQEKYELRLFSKYRDLLGDFIPQTSLPRGTVAIVLRGNVGDALYNRVGELHQQSKAAGDGGVFAGWDIQRTYTRKEIDEAQLFYLRIPYTHLAGEEFGTKYDETTDCVQDAFDIEFPEASGRNPHIIPRNVPCGICSKQASILRVPFRKLSKNRDIVQLWGGELIFSERLATLIRRDGFNGAEFYPVQDLRAEPTRPLNFSACPSGNELVSIAATHGMDPRSLDFWRWLYSDSPKHLLNELLAQQNSSEDDPSLRNLVQFTANSRPLDVMSQ